MSGDGAPMVLAWLRAVASADLSTGVQALAMQLMTFADADGTNCRPGDELLCARLHCKPKTLRDYTVELKRDGFLDLETAASGPGRGHGGGGRAAVWRLPMPVKERRHTAGVLENPAPLPGGVLENTGPL